MHEFSIACEIWQSVLRAAERHGGGAVRSIALEIGELNLIEDEQLTFWITALAERDGSPGVQLKISHLPARVECRECGAVERARPSVPGSARDWVGQELVSCPGACPKCGSREVSLRDGREIRVVSAEIEPQPGCEAGRLSGD